MLIRDRIKELRRVKAEELRPSPHNWREHPQGQRDALRGVLTEIGFADALLAREVDGHLELIDGHLRAEITPEMDVPVLVLDLDEGEAKKLLLTLDPLAAMAEANKDALGRLLHDIETDNAGVQAMLDGLAKEHNIDLFEPAAEEVPEAQVDRAAELQEKWGTAIGQLWVIPGNVGEHRLLCGDCRNAEHVDRVCVQKVNGCFTSPPYAEQRKEQYGGVATADYVDWWDVVQANLRTVLSEDGSLFVNIKPHCENGERVLYVFDLVLAMQRRWGWAFVEEFCWRHSGVPKKPRRRLKNQFEPIYQFSVGTYKFRPSFIMHETDREFHAKNPSVSAIQGQAGADAGAGATIHPGMAYPGNVLPINVETHGGQGAAHAAIFPQKLPAFFLSGFSDPGDRWVDPFLGSGTTMVAAEQLGRICYGIEIEPKYVAVALERLKDMGLTPKLEANA